jgi:hypothetical protein
MDNLHHTCRALRALAPINGSHSHKEHCFASVYGKLLSLIKRHFIFGVWVFGSLGLWGFEPLDRLVSLKLCDSILESLRLFFGISEAFFVKSLRLFRLLGLGAGVRSLAEFNVASILFIRLNAL